MTELPMDVPLDDVMLDDPDGAGSTVPHGAEGALPLEADPADVVDQRATVPLDDEDY